MAAKCKGDTRMCHAKDSGSVSAFIATLPPGLPGD
jgi:hypothetical protein